MTRADEVHRLARLAARGSGGAGSAVGEDTGARVAPNPRQPSRQLLFIVVCVE